MNAAVQSQGENFVPTDIQHLDRVIDLFYYESAADGHALGGAGAFCYYGAPESALLAGTQLEGWVSDLFEHIRQAYPGKEDFRVSFRNTDWRACRDISATSTLIQLRRLPKATPLLKDLRMKEPSIRDLMLAPWLNDGGLLMFCGLTGQGKSTIAASTVRSRLEKYAGRCVVVEDVAELPLEGRHGSGTCRQIAADYDTPIPRLHGFPGAIRRAYRSYPAARPAILFIGEVRDVETAQEVVKAAANGMLVITTIHSFDPVAGLMRLLSLAEQGMGAAAGDAIAQALRMVVHHSLNLLPNQAGWGRGEFTASAIISDGPSHPIANLIRKGQYAQMGSVLMHQKTKCRLASQNNTPAGVLLRELGSQAA